MTTLETQRPTAISPKLTLRWVWGYEKLDFTKPSTWWFFGKRFSGKSSGSEMIAAKHIDKGATVFDLFAARDNENLAWGRSPYQDVLYVVGDNAILKTDLPWCKVSDFSLKEAEKHQVVVTCPGFYLRNEDLQYVSLSRLVDILKWRDEWEKLDVLVVREASRLITSRIRAGKVKSRMEAQYDFIDLHNEAYHTGLTACIDSLRYKAIDIDVREVANYTVVKKTGKMGFPEELKFVLSKVHPNYLRRMPPGDLTLYTDNDNIAVGRFEEVPWHIERGENIMKSLKLVPEPDPKWKSGEVQDAHRGAEPEVNEEIHDRMVEMQSKGASYREIQREMGFSLETIFKHLKGRCSCHRSA